MPSRDETRKRFAKGRPQPDLEIEWKTLRPPRGIYTGPPYGLLSKKVAASFFKIAAASTEAEKSLRFLGKAMSTLGRSMNLSPRGTLIPGSTDE